MLGNSARAGGVGTRFVLLVGYMGGQNAEAEVLKQKHGNRDHISSLCLKQSLHNCIIFYYRTLYVLRPIWNWELQQSL